MKTFEQAIHSETAAKKYLLGLCWKNHQRYCPRCRQRRPYRLASGQYRCRRCRYTFHDFSKRWVGLVNIGPVQWLRLVKYYQLKVPARRAAVDLEVSAPTVLRAYRIIKASGSCHARDPDLRPDRYERIVRQLTNIF